MTKEQCLASKLDVSALPDGLVDKIYQAMELFLSTNSNHTMSVSLDFNKAYEFQKADEGFWKDKKSLPNPSEDDLKHPLFNSMWEVMKTWDIKVPEYYEGYCGANGSHLMLIINHLRKEGVLVEISHAPRSVKLNYYPIPDPEQ